MLNPALKTMFNDKNYTLMTDGKNELQYLKKLGLEVFLYTEGCVLPKNVIFFQSTANGYISCNKTILQKENKDVRVLRIPLLPFNDSLDNLKYSLDKTFTCDYPELEKVRQNVLSIINSSKSFEVTTHENYILNYKIKNSTKCKYPENIIIKEGSSRSIAEYMEICYNFVAEDPESYIINGDFSFRGCVYAMLPTNTSTSSEDKLIASSLSKKLENSSNATLSIKDNFASSLLIDGEEYIDQLYRIVGRKYGLRVIELAFGLNKSIFSNINWSLNSQLNEGCSGIHLGFGDAQNGVHIDFIEPSMNVEELIIPVA